MAETADLNVAVARFVGALLGTARDQSAINVYMAQVVQYYGPRVLSGADGVGKYPWPPSVDVQILPLYTRIVDNLAQAKPTEIPLGQVRGGIQVQGPETPVEAVPVMFIGVGEMVLTEAPIPGVTRGLLILTGKHHATVISDGVPVAPRLTPSVERLSDSFFLPGFLVGVETASLTPDCAPMPGQPAQLGPRTPESTVVHIRRQPGGWIIGGTDVRLGAVTASRPVSGIGDTTEHDSGTVAWAASVVVALAALGQVIDPLKGGGIITSGDPAVKIT